HVDLARYGRRKAREPCVGGKKTRERVGAAPDDIEAGSEVGLPVGRALRSAEHGRLAARDGLDGCEGIVDLVAQDAHEALPRESLLDAQRAPDVGDDEQRMRHAVPAKRRAAELPSRAARCALAIVEEPRGRAVEGAGDAKLARAFPEYVRRGSREKS